MFGKARFRLTLYFAAVVALIVVVVGGGIYFSARKSLYDQVDSDLHTRIQPILHEFAQAFVNGVPPSRAQIPRGLVAGGYTFALVGRDGDVMQSSLDTDEAAFADQSAIDETLQDGPSYFDVQTASGEDVRLYLVPVAPRTDRGLVMQIGRSIEPEQQAIRRLGLILVGGGFAGLGLAIAGGYLLSGLALRPIKSAMDKQQAFVADASHELRTPLSLIRLNAEVLKREAAKPVQANTESVDDIILETDRLTGLVKQMLSLARSDAGGVPLQRVSLDLNALVQDAVREMRLLADDKQVPVRVTANGSLTIEGDPIRLRELMTILIDNSIKYSDAGHSVEVSVERYGARAVLRVADSGRGIPREALPRIFDRFYRADKSRSREMGGTGLGLAIAKWIVDAHHGSIGIESDVGRGTTVTVELPAAG